MTSDVLDEAYARLHRWGPEFGSENGLSNHAPMAVEVLTRRGYDDQVDSRLDRYVARLGDAARPADRTLAAQLRRDVGRVRRYHRRLRPGPATPGPPRRRRAGHRAR